MILLNWKANGSPKLVEEYNALDITPHQMTVMSPMHLISMLDRSKYNIGTQDVSTFLNGSYTGEVTAEMLSCTNVKFCLVGHSERRHYLGEDNKTIATKIEHLLANNITPVLCVGENSLDRANQSQFEILKQQMDVFTENCIIAYEPVWAIGTGSTPTNHEIDDVSYWLKQQYEGSSYVPKVLYGGSVSAKNIQELHKAKIDGILVGKASLDISQVLEISKYFCH